MLLPAPGARPRLATKLYKNVRVTKQTRRTEKLRQLAASKLCSELSYAVAFQVYAQPTFEASRFPTPPGAAGAASISILWQQAKNGHQIVQKRARNKTNA